MKVLALINIENEITLGKEYDCLDVNNEYVLINDVNEEKSYNRLDFGVLPIEEKITKDSRK